LKPKYTFGYFDNNYLSDNLNNINQLVMGIVKAAEKHNVQLIRFGSLKPYSNDLSQEQTDLLEYVAQYRLDGLLCFGLADDLLVSEPFKAFFGTLPILSIGINHRADPGVYFDWGRHFQQLIGHLIEEHGFQKIAYIASSIPDLSSQYYIEIMQQNGIYNPDLYVNETDLTGLTAEERGQKAVSLLLDERMVELDAIISLDNRETGAIIEELQQRGINVPEKIAVTSFDDGDLARYYSPSLTTVYFPWFELGYCGCEQLIAILEHGCSSTTTEVLGRLIIRDSCGCTIKIADTSQTLQELGPEQLSETEVAKIVTKMNEQFYYLNLDYQSLITALIKDLELTGNQYFIDELKRQLDTITESYIATNIGELILVLRGQLLPYFSNSKEKLLRFGDLFQQAQVCLWEKLHLVRGNAELQKLKQSQIRHQVGQELINNFNLDNLFNLLEQNLSQLEIPGCSVIVFDSVFKSAEEACPNRFDSASLAFNYRDRQRIVHEGTTSVTLKEILRPVIDSEAAKPYYTYLLASQHDLIGVVIFEAGPIEENVYQELAEDISVAIRGALLLQRLDNSYNQLLIKAHREGIADVAINILHTIGNVLNSANASLHILKDVITNSPVNELKKANQILAKNLHDFKTFIQNDPKGKKLMEFYVKLTDSFINMQNHLKYHVDRLDEKINSITEIINAQQMYASVKANPEAVDVVGVIEEVLKLQSTSLDRLRITVNKEYQHFPRVIVQRAKLFHILYTIIENAKDAMLTAPEQQRKLSFVVNQSENGKLIYISDTGCGIEPDKLDKIFSYGYSTKKESSGFGLYSCANYMMDIGGHIWAESEGLGRGSTIVLKFI